ncbi:MAG TPA: RimK/LysX family protein [Polyangia bacterium]|jgi:predicted deacylase
MTAESASLGLRVGGVTVGPGEARAVAIALPDRRGDAAKADAVPALVIVGRRRGPRVAILAAARGFEVHAARLATALEALLPPSEVRGTIVIVPVLRPGGRFAAAGRPVKRPMEWRLPGDPAGARVARDAFAVFSQAATGAALVLTVTEADPGRIAAVTIKGDLENPRARRLARLSGAASLVHAKRRRTDESASAVSVAPDALHLEVSIPPFSKSALLALHDQDDPGGAASVFKRLLHLVGAWVAPTRARLSEGTPAAICRHVTTILAPQGGFVDAAAAPGAFVAKGDALARVTVPLARSATTILAPHPGVILEAPARSGVRRGTKLFLLGRLTRAKAGEPPRMVVEPAPELPSNDDAAASPLCLGWVERVALPALGLRLLAKIDTGARTSALHVTRMRVVGTEEGLAHRPNGPARPNRPILEVTIPRGAKKPPRVVRVRVRDYILIKDTSGRTERRPVIETQLRLGPLERKIRVTLTDRGDMLFPMLIGRTALGAGVIVDPSRRRLLPDDLPPAPAKPKPRRADARTRSEGRKPVRRAGKLTEFPQG